MIDYEEIYETAEREQSFKRLIPFRRLLFKWYRFHPNDRQRLSTIASHRLNNHKFCGDKCEAVEKFIQENLTLSSILTA